MRPKRLVPLLVPVSALLALVALAQPKNDPKADAKTEAKTEETEEAAPPSEEPSPATDDLGEPPPARTGPDDPTKRSSPLNPEANEFPDGGVAPPAGEYDAILGDIAALRSRVAALTTTLYKSKLRVVVRIEEGDSRIDRLNLTLDDGVIYSAPERFSAVDEKTVYDHAVAPGHHVIGVEIERHDARGSQFKTWQSSKFSVIVPESKLVEAELLLEDDSDMAEDFPSDEDGEYELVARLRARVEE
jgi:hypothetical protein